jgi:hypothetical protein
MMRSLCFVASLVLCSMALLISDFRVPYDQFGSIGMSGVPMVRVFAGEVTAWAGAFLALAGFVWYSVRA